MKKTLLLVLGLLYFVTFSFAQNRLITGKVVDESGNPLPGVSVTERGGTTGVQTDAQGNFTITLSGTGTKTLSFSYVGYEPQTVISDDSRALSVTMVKSISTMEDVVIIGYQTVKRRDLTGSVSSLSGRQLKDIPINSAAQALAGRLAGVQVTGTEGSPDAEVLIRVRGGGSITQDNSPLYIIDGIQVENGLSVISPQDIESIDVLKDASATAIYGARGANGVVIITTKGGKAGKPTISYNGLVGVDKLANKLEVMRPYDFIVYQYERAQANGTTEQNNFRNRYGNWQDLDLYKEIPFADWQEEVFGRLAFRQSHNVSLVGGNNGTTYNLSLTYNKQEGVLLQSDFDRKLVNFRFDHTFSKVLKVGFNTRFNNTVVNGAGTSAAGSSSTNRLRHSVKFRPFVLPGQGLEEYDFSYVDETNANSLGLVNPILLAQAEYRKDNGTTTNLNGYIDLTLAKFLTFRSTLGVDLYNLREYSFDDTITGSSRQNGGKPLAGINLTNRTTINNSNVLTFSNSKLDGNFHEKNNISVLVGEEIYQSRTRRENQFAREFPVGIDPEKALANMNLGTAYLVNNQPPSFQTENHLLSFFGRIMYDYDQRFLTQFSLRADGSSKFASANRWGYFPSGSVAWRISQEKFFDGLSSAVNDLKLRVSYGEAGNNRIDDFLYLTQFTSGTQYWINDQLITAFMPADLANENLKWETTVSRNIGLDISFLKNKFQFSVDVYRNSVKDLLIRVPVPTTTGYTIQYQNVGATESKGVEFQLTANIVNKKDFTWDATFNTSFNRVKVKSLGSFVDFYFRTSGWGFSNTPADFIVKEGELLGSMWGFETDGMYSINDFTYDPGTGTYTLNAGVPDNTAFVSAVPEPGRLKFKDQNKDGQITEADKKIIGVAQPKVFGGLNQQLRYKNFDLSVFVNFQLGAKVYNANKLEFTNGYQPNANMLAIMNDRWRTIDDNGQVVTDPVELAKLNANARLWIPSTSSTSFLLHSWAIESGDFLRINNITLGYNLPPNLLKKLSLKGLRAYATVNNVAVITGYSGYDPEVSTRRGSPETPGVDYSAYPRSRTFIFGLNLSL